MTDSGSFARPVPEIHRPYVAAEDRYTHWDYRRVGRSGLFLPPLSLGFVSLLGAGLIIPASVLAAPLGVRLAHGISRRKLELAFSVFLALVVARFLVSLILE